MGLCRYVLRVIYSVIGSAFPLEDPLEEVFSACASSTTISIQFLSCSCYSVLRLQLRHFSTFAYFSQSFQDCLEIVFGSLYLHSQCCMSHTFVYPCIDIFQQQFLFIKLHCHSLGNSYVAVFFIFHVHVVLRLVFPNLSDYFLKILYTFCCCNINKMAMFSSYIL